MILPDMSLTALILLAGWLAVIAETDRRTGRIPNALLWPGVLGVGVAGCAHPEVLFAAAAGSVGYLVAFVCGRCGGADVKLGFVLGGLLAHPMSALVMVVLAQVGLLVVHRRAGPRRRPHGPTLVTAAVIVVVLGFALG
ncbi:A24 family peptidase [Gordonia sp. DT30]|uniref:A24 family peptidase n=1 Tax=unclassified Gordonia (in: high G+C Gram-positive bacteria) TaxID=2657482 RepID=UPI003CF23915